MLYKNEYSYILTLAKQLINWKTLTVIKKEIVIQRNKSFNYIQNIIVNTTLHNKTINLKKTESHFQEQKSRIISLKQK